MNEDAGKNITEVEEEYEYDAEDLLNHLIAKCRFLWSEARHEEMRTALAIIEESIHPILARVIVENEAWSKALLNESET